ncbi:MAG: hypothetical protein II656_02360 [Ruminococcus sp.]|nr:hypothetical protein [Ruminococcus sp.]
MVTVKRDTIQTNKFEHEVAKVINNVKRMDLPDKQKNDLLDQLRELHIGCLEYGTPVQNFKAFETRLP